MTVISSYEVDNSAALAKRFAALAQGYLNHPETAKVSAAQVPLENIYRMLEMFRYRSFEDESRRGVLALEREENQTSLSLGEPPWHESIVDALDHAILTAFSGITTDRAIDELEKSLRWLAKEKGGRPSDDNLERARRFFTVFQARV